MTLKSLLVFLLAFLHLSCVNCYEEYEGYQLWRMIPRNEVELEFLSTLAKDHENFDFWKVPTGIGATADILVSPAKSERLEKDLQTVDLHYTAIIKDLQEVIGISRAAHVEASKSRQRSRRSLDEFDYSVYHPADEIYEWMDWIVARYSFITKVQMGVTYEGRPMYSLEIRKDAGVVKPVMYIDALTHCREWITAATMLYTLHLMLTNPAYQNMLDDYDWYYIPMVNVDGYVETWTGDRLWRKSRSTGASSICKGVDLNRNFDDHWSGEGATSDPCGSMFYGPTPASESETRHVMNYIKGKGDITALNSTAKAQSEAVFAVHKRKYAYGPGSSTLYVHSGVTTDWAYNKAGIKLSYSYELRDEGELAFKLPDDQIIPNTEEFIEGLKVLGEHAKTTI